MAFTSLLLIPWNSLTHEARGRSRLMRCLRTKKQVASTADMASNEMKDMAMIDHAEFSKLGIIHNSMSVLSLYFVSNRPEALEINTACIFIPAEVPAIATKSPSSLSYTMAALKPAVCALRTLSSKLHPPLMINANGEAVTSPTKLTLLVKGEQASRGSATCNLPHFPEPLTGGAKLASMSSNDKVMLLPIKTTLANALQPIKHRKLPNKTQKFDISQSNPQEKKKQKNPTKIMHEPWLLIYSQERWGEGKKEELGFG